MFRAILGVAALALALIGPLVYAGPQLASDLAVGERWTPADDLTVRESKCTRWYFLVSTCHIEYASRRDPTRVGGTLNYLVLGSWAGERVSLLRSTRDPGAVGTTLGLQHMRQRLISFGVFVALALAVLAGFFRRVLLALRSDEPSPARVSRELPAEPEGVKTFGLRRSPSAG